MKTNTLKHVAGLGALASTLIVNTATAETGFGDARRSVSNIVHSDLPVAQTIVRPIFIHHKFPDRVNLAGGGQIQLGGDLQLYALQLEYAVNERLGLIAVKDGYIDFNPDNTTNFAEEEGFADLAAGVKYAFIYDEAESFAVTGKVVLELPTGNDSVWQGNGNGTIDPGISAIKLYDRWQFSGTIGGIIPFDDERSTSMYSHIHVSYAVTETFMPLLELNYFRVIDDGNGDGRFNPQVGGAVPAAVNFEGSDLVNLGASNADQNPDFVSAAFGFRARVKDNIDLGIAFEFPLTDKEESLLENRFTLDAVIRF